LPTAGSGSLVSSRICSPYERPRLTTTKLQGDKDAPLFDLSALSESELAFLRRTVLKAQQMDERE
jgi:hypothetical protein